MTRYLESQSMIHYKRNTKIISTTVGVKTPVLLLNILNNKNEMTDTNFPLYRSRRENSIKKKLMMKVLYMYMVAASIPTKCYLWIL